MADPSRSLRLLRRGCFCGRRLESLLPSLGLLSSLELA